MKQEDCKVGMFVEYRGEYLGRLPEGEIDKQASYREEQAVVLEVLHESVNDLVKVCFKQPIVFDSPEELDYVDDVPARKLTRLIKWDDSPSVIDGFPTA